MFKKWLVKKFVDCTHEWNHEMHKAIEDNVLEESRRYFPSSENGEKINQDKNIKRMREFYYHRMMSTASLLLSSASCSVAIIALLVAIIALYK
ncbi:hypothetical protein [Photorhabdus laumondii]|uniref:hypothetical protein n=1 Tax=Photorhabdus laumondii TaxID=2218628 RepID=UPI003314CE17